MAIIIAKISAQGLRLAKPCWRNCAWQDPVGDKFKEVTNGVTWAWAKKLL